MTGLEHYKKRDYLSITSLEQFARCPRKFFYGSGCGLRQPEEHAALSFGGAMHKGIPIVLSGGSIDDAMKEFDTIFDASMGDDTRNRPKAIEMLRDVQQNRTNGRGLYNILQPPSGIADLGISRSQWEIPFAIDIGLPVPLVGLIDGWCQHIQTGEKWVLEYKTSREVSTRFLEGFTSNPQVIGYTLALKMLSGEPVRGCMVEALRVGKTIETTCQPIYVTPQQIEMFIKWARFYGTLLLKCEELGDFPQALTGCNPYHMFGMPGYTCDFSHLCHSTDDWTKLMDLFKVNRDHEFRVTPLSVKKTEGVLV